MRWLKITEKDFRFHFYSTAHNLTFKVPKFKPTGKPYQVPRSQPTKQIIKPKKKTLTDHIKSLIKIVFGPSLTIPKLPTNYKQSTNNKPNNNEDEIEEDTAFGVPIDFLENQED